MVTNFILVVGLAANLAGAHSYLCGGALDRPRVGVSLSVDVILVVVAVYGCRLFLRGIKAPDVSQPSGATQRANTIRRRVDGADLSTCRRYDC
jgi:hypothetical protein